MLFVHLLYLLFGFILALAIFNFEIKKNDYNFKDNIFSCVFQFFATILVWPIFAYMIALESIFEKSK